jgi:hypothetical protein
MLDIIPPFTDLQIFDEKEYLVEQSAGDEAEGGIRIGKGFDAGGYPGSERGGTIGRGREEEELDDAKLEELEYTKYIRLVADTMAEIKDSLAWLERSS